MSPDSTSAVVRSLGFVLLLQAAGAVFFAALVSDLLDRSAATIRRLQFWPAVAAVAAMAVHLALEPARLSGEYAGMFDPELQALVVAGSSAKTHAMQIAGLAAIAVGACGRGRAYRVLAVVGAMATVVAFLLTGHTSVRELRVDLTPMLFIHLMIVAFWFGSLLPLYAMLRQETSAVAAAALQQFSSKAVWLVPFIAVAGVRLLLGIAHGLPDFRAPYGALILAKVAGFALLMGLAAWNKLRLVPAVGDGQPRAVHQLKWCILAEFSLLVAVLSVTAVMISFYSPD